MQSTDSKERKSRVTKSEVQSNKLAKAKSPKPYRSYHKKKIMIPAKAGKTWVWNSDSYLKYKSAI